MQGVLEGFGTIGIPIALGFLLGHVGALDERGQQTLSWLAFYVATPPLMVLVLAEADLAQLLSGSLAAHVIAVVVIAAVTAALFRAFWRAREWPGTGSWRRRSATPCCWARCSASC